MHDVSCEFAWAVKARIHGAILRATFVTRRGYTVATFRATLRAIFDQRLPSSHAMMFTSRNPN